MDIEVSLSDAIAVPGPGHNRLQALLDSAMRHGGQAALGVTALQQLGLEVIEASHDGVVRPESAARIAQNYADGCKSAGGTPGSVKTNASKLRKLMDLGILNGGLKIAKEALRVRSEIEKPKSPFETLVEVARHCHKSKSCELADDEIKAVIARPAPKEKCKAKAEREPEAAETTFTGWQSLAIQVNELIGVKDDDGMRAAYAIRAQLDNYLKDESYDVCADEPARRLHDARTIKETIEVDEAAQAPPAVNVEEEDITSGDLHEQ